MYYETPEFRKDAEFMNTLYAKGLATRTSSTCLMTIPVMAFLMPSLWDKYLEEVWDLSSRYSSSLFVQSGLIPRLQGGVVD
jgi:hypothetical protein